MTNLPPDRDPATRPVQGLGLDELPPELEGIQRDLLADAAEWARGVPPSARFNQRLRAVLPLDEPASAAESAPRQTQVVHHAPGEAPNEPRPQHARADVRAHPTRLGTMLALAATIAVVALLAAVFATLRPGGQASHHTATSTSTATPQPIVALPLRATYSGQPGIPVVAASNPDVIYEYGNKLAGPVVTRPLLRRSDDGGANWHTLAYPAAPNTFVSNLVLAVNPNDAANVFLGVVLAYHPGAPDACMPNEPGQKSTLCANEYVSTDSGAQWSPMHYPVPGMLFPSGVSLQYDAGSVQAQGSQIYAAVRFDNTLQEVANGIRIISSRDHGKTWQVADAALAAAGLHICDFAAAPRGATLFARTAAICQGETVSPRQLWRSDDAGAHWRQVTSFGPPYNSGFNTFTVASVAGTGSNQMIVYAGVPDQRTGVISYYASLDGGVTWQLAPVAGLPTGAQAASGTEQTLRDGSLVVVFAAGGAPWPGAATPPPATPATLAPPNWIACYTWKPGQDRWVQLTQPVAPVGPPANLYVADGAQHVVVLTLADGVISDETYAIERFS